MILPFKVAIDSLIKIYQSATSIVAYNANEIASFINIYLTKNDDTLKKNKEIIDLSQLYHKKYSLQPGEYLTNILQRLNIDSTGYENVGNRSRFQMMAFIKLT